MEESKIYTATELSNIKREKKKEDIDYENHCRYSMRQLIEKIRKIVEKYCTKK